jgi:hypothetical protein
MARKGSSSPDSKLCRGIAKLVKALDFDSSIPRFESLFPCHLNEKPMTSRHYETKTSCIGGFSNWLLNF